MLHYNTLGIQYKNKIYILFSSNASKENLFRLIKNYEYNLNFLFYMFLIENNVYRLPEEINILNYKNI